MWVFMTGWTCARRVGLAPSWQLVLRLQHSFFMIAENMVTVNSNNQPIKRTLTISFIISTAAEVPVCGQKDCNTTCWGIDSA